MAGAVRWVLNVFFPQTCPGCAQPSKVNGLCEACLAHTRPVQSPICPVCGVPFPAPGTDHACSACRQAPPRFDQARACAVYRDAVAPESPLAAALHRYKYLRDVTLAPGLGGFLADRCPMVIDHDLLLPVPLHIQRLRWRGFNQALLLAKPLARRYGIDLNPFLLSRTRPTRPQVGLSDRERRDNIAGAFAVRRPDAIDGRIVLLVDDVYTTGATVDECARTLRRAGARRVDVLTLARAVLR